MKKGSQWRRSIASGPEDAAFRHAAGEDAGGGLPASQFAERDAADGDAQALGEFLFLFRGAVPRHLEPIGVSFSGEVFFQFPQGAGGADVGIPEGDGPLEQGILDVLENVRNGINQFRFRDKGFFIDGQVAPLEADGAFFQVPGADFQAHGHSLLHPFPFLGAAAQVAPVHQYAERLAMEILGAEGACQFLAVVQNGLAAFFLGRNGDDDDLLGSHAGRADQAVVVGVHHDERTDHAGGDAPGAGPGELLGVVPPGKADVLGFGEVLPQEVGGPGLDGLAVL